MNTRIAVTFIVFVLWLHNQHYYTHDVIGIKWCKGIYPTRKISGPKHAVNINFTKISRKIMQTLYIPLSMTWSLSGRSKHWPIHHSMACTAIHSLRDSDIIKKNGRPNQDCGGVKKLVAILCRFIPSKPLLLWSSHCPVWDFFCIWHRVSIACFWLLAIAGFEPFLHAPSGIVNNK